MLVFCLTMVYNGFLVKELIFGGFQDCVLEFLERNKAYAKGLVWRVSKIFPSSNESYADKQSKRTSSITGSTHLIRQTI